MFLEESDKVKRYVGGLPDNIHDSVMASKPKTMQDAIEFATELMDKKILSYAERQTKNKRKFDDISRNNQNQQQENKRPLQEGLPPVEEQEPGKWQRSPPRLMQWELQGTTQTTTL
ncbi:hypothetical protein Tco_0859124 [Tanacetum coccineum]|uniref:Reverse transcriptase domain-containing protein n=1 Tax=Tanacetum coccineum TaxID=301880 RepID=A0ABQ5BE26_9ASTR